MSINNKNETIISGFYTTIANKKMRPNGVFFSTLNSKGEIRNRSHKFAPSFIKEVCGEKSDFEDGIPNIGVDDIVKHDDNSISVIAEYRYETRTESTSSNGKIKYTVWYHSNSIIVPRFSENGDLLNIVRVSKRLRSKIYTNTSYTCAPTKENGLMFVYNIDKFKFELEKGEKKGVYTELAVIDKAGDLQTKTLFNDKESKKKYLPSYSKRVDVRQSEMLILKMRGGTFQIGLLKLK